MARFYLATSMVVAGKSVHSEPRMKHGRCVSVLQQKPGLDGRRATAKKKRKSHVASPGLSVDLVPSSGPGESGPGRRPWTLSSWDT